MRSVRRCAAPARPMGDHAAGQMMRGPFKAKRRGAVEANLTDIEADALRMLAKEILDSLDDADETQYRLFPPGYTDDTERSKEFQRMTRDDLVTGKRSAAN